MDLRVRFLKAAIPHAWPLPSPTAPAVPEGGLLLPRYAVHDSAGPPLEVPQQVLAGFFRTAGVALGVLSDVVRLFGEGGVPSRGEPRLVDAVRPAQPVADAASAPAPPPSPTASTTVVVAVLRPAPPAMVAGPAAAEAMCLAAAHALFAPPHKLGFLVASAWVRRVLADKGRGGSLAGGGAPGGEPPAGGRARSPLRVDSFAYSAEALRACAAAPLPDAALRPGDVVLGVGAYSVAGCSAALVMDHLASLPLAGGVEVRCARPFLSAPPPPPPPPPPAPPTPMQLLAAQLQALQVQQARGRGPVRPMGGTGRHIGPLAAPLDAAALLLARRGRGGGGGGGGPRPASAGAALRGSVSLFSPPAARAAPAASPFAVSLHRTGRRLSQSGSVDSFATALSAASAAPRLDGGSAATVAAAARVRTGGGSAAPTPLSSSLRSSAGGRGASASAVLRLGVGTPARAPARAAAAPPLSTSTPRALAADRTRRGAVVGAATAAGANGRQRPTSAGPALQRRTSADPRPSSLNTSADPPLQRAVPRIPPMRGGGTSVRRAALTSPPPPLQPPPSRAPEGEGASPPPQPPPPPSPPPQQQQPQPQETSPPAAAAPQSIAAFFLESARGFFGSGRRASSQPPLPSLKYGDARGVGEPSPPPLPASPSPAPPPPTPPPPPAGGATALVTQMYSPPAATPARSAVRWGGAAVGVASSGPRALNLNSAGQGRRAGYGGGASAAAAAAALSAPPPSAAQLLEQLTVLAAQLHDD
jgi:hypothetical protein